MYVRHPPEEHDEAAQRRKAGQKYTPPDYRPDWKPDGESNPPSKTTASAAHKLELIPKLKEVLCTNLCLSKQDYDKLIAEAQS